MADGTHIEWTDATWNPITGCSVVSAGCKHCYAMKLAGTRLKHTASREGLTIDTPAGPVWNGVVRFNEQWLDQPLRWRRPRRIFVCAHSDLFNENVPDDWIDKVFAVMALAPRHTFQVLTKRAQRMHDYVHTPFRANQIVEQMPVVAPKRGVWSWPGEGVAPRNVWLGVSVEDQRAADERIPLLLRTPAHVRWLSAEPLLGSIDLERIRIPHNAPWNAMAPRGCSEHAPGYCLGGCPHRLPGIDWVVAGGESGPGARPMDPDWAQSLRDQCAVARVPFLFKQWGDWIPMLGQREGVPVRARTTTRSGWVMGLAGKRAAGRELDGRLHDEYPTP